ncbi:hypothetical protein BGX27_003226 [Mortierella sp. AM989]|nr:hypothetical protein BGX27_003226 [Mortierella sp. AM989]
MATCKSMFQQLEPFLWRHASIKSLPPLRNVMLRNCHYIRTLYISNLNEYCLHVLSSGLLEPPTKSEMEISYTTSAAESLQSFASLQKLVISKIGIVFELVDSINPQLFLTVLHHSPNLIYLEMPYPIFLQRSTPASLFQKLLFNDLRQLVHLKFLGQGEKTIDTSIAMALLAVGLLHPQLQELSFNFTMAKTKKDPDFSAVLDYLKSAKTSDGSFKSKISSLRLPTYDGGYPISFLESLLGDHVPAIESFSIPNIVNGSQVDLSEAIGGLCHRIQHIDCSVTAANLSGAIVKAFISGRSQKLRTFRATPFDDFDRNKRPLDVMKTLIQHHSETLENIELLDCTAIKSEEIQNIFKTCGKLKRCWITSGAKKTVSIDFDDIVSGEWLCHDLEELSLVLNRGTGGGGGGDVIMGPPESVAERVYAQIGRLVKLEKLALGCNMDEGASARAKDFDMDLTLQQGWLAELSGLVELQHLHMVTSFWWKMGQAEVEFMHANWPHLERITLRGANAKEFQHVEELPHWQWLRKQRPILVMEY